MTWTLATPLALGALAHHPQHVVMIVNQRLVILQRQSDAHLTGIAVFGEVFGEVLGIPLFDSETRGYASVSHWCLSL